MRLTHFASIAAVFIVAAACGGTAVVDGEFGEGGNGGDGNNAGANNTVSNGGNNGGNTVNSGGNAVGGNAVGGNGGNGANGGNGGNAGAGGNPGCISCSEFVTNGLGDPDNLCPSSQDILVDLFSCVCGFGCPAQCQASICSGQGFPDDPCFNCIGTVCGSELDACLNDV